MLKLKIRLFFLEHKIITYLILILSMLLIMSKISFKISMPNDPTTIGVLGTLLGAIVGGLFSLIGSIYVNNKKIISESEIKKKNVIYRPLYDELLDTKKIIEIENRYPTYVRYQKGQQTITRHPQITAWQRICSDSRILDTPNVLKEQYQRYLKSIENYTKVRNEANEIIQSVINKTVKDEIGKENTITNLGSCLSDEILDNTLTGNKLKSYWHLSGEDENSNDKWDEVASKISSKCNNFEEIKTIRNAYNDWISIQDETIKLLELLILEINIKYEKQRR